MEPMILKTAILTWTLGFVGKTTLLWNRNFRMILLHIGLTHVCLFVVFAAAMK